MYVNEFVYDKASIDEATKLTQNEIAILKNLEDKDNYGTKIIEAFLFASDGKISLSNGTIYPALKKLVKKGFLVSYEDESDLVKRKGKKRVMYSITKKGRSALQSLHDFFEEMKSYE